MKRKYEFTVIYKEGDDDKKEGMALVENILSKNNAKVLNKNELGVKKLAYEIKKNQRGFYVFYLIETDSTSIDIMGKEFNLSNILLRYLFVEKEDMTAGQKKKREEKEKKMRDFLATKARNMTPPVSTVQDKDKDAEEGITEVSEGEKVNE